jgi:uncharacterized membrane protein YiaA
MKRFIVRMYNSELTLGEALIFFAVLITILIGIVLTFGTHQH